MELYDKVTQVLDDYGILYGDIVENDDGSINIVGVEEEEWDEVVDAIKEELGLDVLVPDSDHEELDNELIVRESLKESCVKYTKPTKEEIEQWDPDFDICCKDVANGLDGGYWHGQTSSERSWGLSVNGKDGNQFSPLFADVVAYEISYPVRDGLFSYSGLDCVPNKSTFSYMDEEDWKDEDKLETLRNDLLSVGCEEEEIEKFFKDEISEIEFFIDYEIDIDDLEEDEEEEETDESLKESKKDDFVIEDKFIEYMKSQGIKNPIVFDEKGFFLDGVYEKYAQGVADTYLDGDIDYLDGLCNEEQCFAEDEEIYNKINNKDESLKEAKEEDKLETFEDKMDFLAKDEQEAIDGYDKVIAMLDKEQDAFVIEQLTKIKIEEEAHKKYLEEVKTNHELEYTEPLEQDELEEGKTSAQKYNDMLHRTFEMAKKANLAMKDFLIKNGVSEEEAEKLYQDTGLHGSPLQQKLIDMGLKDEFFSKYDYSKGVMKESKQIKEAQEGFTTFLNLECGVLLEEDDPEFKDYSVAYDHKHGYYDETYLNSLEGDLELLKESGLDYIKKGVNGTYAILTKVDVQGTMEDDFIKDAIKDIEDGMYIDNSIDFLDNEQFKASNVIWSAYKDANGEIHENFVDTSVVEGCKKELKEYNLPKDAKPYKTCGDKEYYIATFDDVDRAMMGNKATHTIVTKKVGGDFDMGSASGLDFDSEEEAKKWIDDACSLKEDVSDEVSSKLQSLYDEGGVYFDTADDDGETFLIVDGWEDVHKIQKALKPDFEPKDEYDTSVLDEIFSDEWGFRDEYAKCDRTGKLIRTEPDSYSWVPDFFVTEDGEILCGDYVRENPQEYLETLYNNPEKANTILSAKDLEAQGFEKIDGDYEDGWYDKHDSPKEILDKALEAHPSGVFIFNISGQGQFATQFELWGADLDLDESKKKDIEEKKTKKISYEDALAKLNSGDWDNERFNDAIMDGEVEMPKNESIKESYKDNDIIEFEDDTPMTFGDIVEMMYNRLSKEDNLVENLEEEAIKCAKNFIEEKGGHKATKDVEK